MQKCRTYDVTLTGKNAFIFSFSLSWLLKSNHAGTLCNSFWARSANVNAKNLTFRYSYYQCKSSRENVWACTKCLLYPPDIPTPHIPTRKKPAHMFLNPPVMNLCSDLPIFLWMTTSLRDQRQNIYPYPYKMLTNSCQL